jgi:hypothetical protein
MLFENFWNGVSVDLFVERNTKVGRRMDGREERSGAKAEKWFLLEKEDVYKRSSERQNVVRIRKRVRSMQLRRVFTQRLL